MKVALSRIGTMHPRDPAQVTEVDEVLLGDLAPGGAHDVADRFGDGLTACSLARGGPRPRGWCLHRHQHSLAVGLSEPEHTRLAFVGSDGRTVAAEPSTAFPTPFAPAYTKAFCNIIAGCRYNSSPSRDSLLSPELAEACQQSRRCGTPVRNLSAPSSRPRAEQV